MEESFWKQTYEKILIGMGLFGITLNFLFLNQILPFLGALLLFTGFRKLRLENRWLKAGYAGAALKVVITIVNNEAYDTNQNFPFYGSQQYASIFAEFSMPHRGENCRGYVAYEIKAKESDWWIDSWLNYTHQKTIWQYPVISAAQNRKQGGWLNERVFSTVQDALQVLPEGERENSVGLGM